MPSSKKGRHFLYFLAIINIGDRMNRENKRGKKLDTEMSVTAILGQPETLFDLVNKYGTYEIQPTSDSGNEFPAISQGLPKRKK